MTSPEMFRPYINYWLSGIGGAMSGLFLWSSFVPGGTVTEWTGIFIAIVAIDLIYIFLLRPKIIFYDEGLVITNPVTQYRIGWQDVEEIETRWALTLELKGRRISAWAAPGPGRHHARTVHPSEVKGLRIAETGSIRPALSPRTDSGVATHLAQLRLDQYRSKTSAPSLDFEVTHFWQAPLVGIVCLIGAVILNFLSH